MVQPKQDLPKKHKAQSKASLLAEKAGYVFSWFLLAVAICFCIVGSYAVYDVVVSRPKANILVTNKTLSPARRTEVGNILNNVVQGNFFTADLHDINEEVQSLDWVNSVKVSRQWPDGITIDVLPHHPVARFGSERLVSSDGSVYKSEDVNLAKYQALPSLHGPQDKAKEIMNQYVLINQWFKPVGLYLDELSVTDNMTWVLTFNNGLSVIADNDNNEKKIFNFSVLLNKKLKHRVNEIDSVDLRYKNNLLAIKPKSQSSFQLDMNEHDNK